MSMYSSCGGSACIQIYALYSYRALGIYSGLRGSEVSLAVAKEDVRESSPLLARTEYVESALIELERERHSRVQVGFSKLCCYCCWWAQE